MKFMKLGSKPDSFQTDGDNIRYVATELATDVIVNVGDVKFNLHKFPLLSKSARLQKLVSNTYDDSNTDEINIHDIPGGPIAFELCAKFCYGMTVTLNAYNVVAARCAAEYLEMYETIEKGNLVYKIEVFLNSSIFRSWKDSIIVLKTTKSLLPWSEELKIVSHCLDSISSKASIDTSKVDWSYTYNRKKLPLENGIDPNWNGTRQQQAIPKDWWVEDLCELQLDSYKRVITTIKSKQIISSDVIGESLRAYVVRKLPGFNKGIIQGDITKNQTLVETISWLIPYEKGSVSCSFLIMLLKAALLLECEEMSKKELIKKIGQQLEEASAMDLLIRAPTGEDMMYDVDTVRKIVDEFLMWDLNARNDSNLEIKLEEMRSPGFVSDNSKMRVAMIVDSYLAEIARDPNLPFLLFVDLSEKMSGFSRLTHDGLYRAIDMYLKEHPGISKSEKKKVCNLMNCKKLSADACTHAVQNERLPLRVVVQVLFFEQVRAASSSSNGSSTPDLPGSVRALIPGGSHGSSRSATTNTDEDWDSVPTSEEIKALKGEIASLRTAACDKKGKLNDNNISKENEEKVGKMKNMIISKKMFSKIWSNKDKSRENRSADASESNAEEVKSNSSRSRRLSVS